MNDDELWTSIDEVEAVDTRLADVLRDMAGALHDTVSAPDIAENLESTRSCCSVDFGVDRRPDSARGPTSRSVISVS